MEVLERTEWQPRAEAHAARVDRWLQPHLARREAGVSHPVHDFLFTYYSHRPAQLRRWHPGYGVTLAEAPEYAGLKGYGVSTRARWRSPYSTTWDGTGGRVAVARDERRRVETTVSDDNVASQRPLIESLHRLLTATASRPPSLGCFGLHEWAMVYRLREHETRHAQWPLRLGAGGTDAVVESHTIACSHFDAFRFFTDPARPRNTLSPGPDDRTEFEQPGCLHANMDLYKHAFRLSPMVSSDLVADCFELAWEIREVDMRASPYDLAGLGLEPIAIETPEGKREYSEHQRDFSERAAPLRSRLVAECERLLAAPSTRGGLDTSSPDGSDGSTT